MSASVAIRPWKGAPPNPVAYRNQQLFLLILNSAVAGTPAQPSSRSGAGCGPPPQVFSFLSGQRLLLVCSLGKWQECERASRNMRYVLPRGPRIVRLTFQLDVVKLSTSGALPTPKDGIVESYSREHEHVTLIRGGPEDLQTKMQTTMPRFRSRITNRTVVNLHLHF